nr:retrotransposon Orf1 [Tanacetum cinerariifolium]
MKARGTLLMALPNKDQLKFHSYQDAKLLMEAIEKRALRNQDNRGREYGRTTIQVETPIDNALIAQDGIGGQVSDKSKVGLGYKELIPKIFVISFELLEKQNNRSTKGYHEVSPPLTGNYMPIKRDLRLIDEHFESESVDVSTVSSSVDKTVKTVDITHKDDDSEDELSPTVEVKTVKPSVEKIEYVKTPRETVKTAESHKPHKYYLRGNKRNWNNLMSHRLGSNFKMINKACYVCGSFEHLQYVCDNKDVRPIRNNSNRVKHKKIANKFTHPHPKRGFIPQAVLTRSAKINTTAASVNTAVRPVNVAGSQSTVNHSRPISKGKSSSKWKHGKKVNAVKATTCWVWKAKNSSASTTFKKYSYIDARGNKCYLTDFEAFDGGLVSFGDGK